jgi:heme-degrading monooxygenase HmoA
MICRLWRSLVSLEEADRYVDLLHRKSLAQLAELPGFVDASILRREVDRGAEFLIVTRWVSLKAIEQFAGTHWSVAVVPPELQPLMIDYDRSVRHYEVIE